MRIHFYLTLFIFFIFISVMHEIVFYLRVLLNSMLLFILYWNGGEYKLFFCMSERFLWGNIRPQNTITLISFRSFTITIAAMPYIYILGDIFCNKIRVVRYVIVGSCLNGNRTCFILHTLYRSTRAVIFFMIYTVG